MKTVFYTLAFCLAAFLTACSERQPADPTVDQIEMNRQDSLPADNTREVGDYRLRLGQRLQEIETDIETVSAKKKAERNAEKVKAYDVDIERKEKRRTEFKEKMDRFEERSRANWQGFRQELDDLFDRDRRDTDSAAVR